MAPVRTTQGTSSGSNTRRGYRYDVFLSFRGEDTRNKFTDHLYTALKNAGYLTFRDDDELETGEDIKSGLKQAIQMSQTSVVVFSEDYASSTWCLDELVEIVDHKRTSSDHVVIPVFYDVDPSHVRKQTGSFAEAFARYRKTEPPDRMERWKEALAEVANLAGKVLQNQAYRCLVTIGMDNELNMHDVIRDMGREIVRQESNVPGNRSRLWRPEDSFEVLRKKNGTEAIEGLILDMDKLLANSPINSNETVLETNAFARMHKLKLLHLRHVLLDGCYAKLPTGLRWLCWPGFPLDSIPVDFYLEEVVFLEMQCSGLRQVFKEAKFLPSLKILDVSHSHGLIEIMDFSLCPCLEELILVDCTSLVAVPESIGNLERLVYLNMKDCKNLRMIPKNMCLLKSLETLILSGCSNLGEFRVQMMKKMESLKVLETDGIPLSELWPQRSSSILSSFPCSLVELNLSSNHLWGCQKYAKRWIYTDAYHLRK
ncbi:unnamed protein product [Malus baccata var. baccata]